MFKFDKKLKVSELFETGKVNKLKNIKRSLINQILLVMLFLSLSIFHSCSDDDVVNNKQNPLPSVTLTVDNTTIAEASGSAIVTATLSAESPDDVAVTLSVKGTATETSDYSISPISLNISSGNITDFTTVTAIDDSIDEDNETVIVEIASVTNGIENGTQLVTITITDDDNPSPIPSVTLTIDNTTIAEASGSAIVTATLSAESPDDVTVTLSVNGTATETSDYTISPISLNISSGNITAFTTITAIDDSIDEDNETVIVEIASVTNGIENGTQLVTITITDDDNYIPPTGTISGTIEHGGLQREYILYVPESYTGEEAVPLIFNFHGHYGTSAEHMEKGDFRTIADTAGFIIVHPQGTLNNDGDTHWNVYTFGPGNTPDDVGFTGALLDSIASEYNIDLTRVYAAGMSMGGFMSYFIACQLSDKFAAIASVTGSMVPSMLSGCNTQHPMPILEIHGTNDVSVPYDGAYWTEPINTVLQHWIDFNNCNPNATTIALPDIDPSDGSTVEYIVYSGGDNGVTVEHYKVTGGTHTWPSGGYIYYDVNFDIDASVEIWKFFSKYDINGIIN